MRQHGWRRLGIVVGMLPALVGSLVLGAPPAAASSEPAYFIALGDSLPLGEQALGEREIGEFVGESTVTLKQGFVEHMAQELSERFPGLIVRNLACSGETTWGMRHAAANEEQLAEGRPAGCKPPARYREDYPRPGHTQLTEAVAMLQELRGAVKLVTVTAGANDIHLWCLTTSAGVCHRGLNDVLRQVREEMTAILSELNAARRPSTRLVGTIYYNPYQRPGEEQHRAAVDALNATLTDVYEQAGVPVARADQVMSNAESVCALTTWCKRLDPHPNDAGYRAMGDEFLRVLGW